MTDVYRLSLTPPLSLEEAWSALEQMGIEILYGSEDQENVELFVHLSTSTSLQNFDWIKACEPYTLPPIDWEAQWAAHGHEFHEGYVHIDITAFGRSGPTLRLQPGSGFGDLSHPTTCLMIHLLAQHLQTETVIDIGCGSGILSLAAIAIGAPAAYGIDLDRQAIEHSRQNAVLNCMEGQSIFSTPSEFTWQTTSKPILMLMNMIRTEQFIAWSSLPMLHQQSGILLTSGIRIEERDLYLVEMTQAGWYVKEEQEKEGWLAFLFYRSNS